MRDKTLRQIILGQINELGETSCGKNNMSSTLIKRLY